MKTDKHITLPLNPPIPDESVPTTISIPYSAKVVSIELAKDNKGEYHPRVVIYLPYDDGIYHDASIIDIPSTTNKEELAFARYLGTYSTPTGMRYVLELFK